MQVFQVLLNPVLPVFAIIIFGYWMGHSGRTSSDEARLINRLAMSVFLPIMIFGVIASAPVRSFSPTPVFIYAAVEAGVFILGYQLATRLFKRDASEAVLLGFCGIFANNVFYVLPISVLLYGADNVLPITTIITLDTTITFAAALLVLQLIRQGRVTVGTVAVTVARSPALYAIALGLVFSLATIDIAAPVQTFIDFNGAAAAPLALFALGVVMSATVFRLDAAVVTFTLIKVLIFPLAIAAALALMANDNPDRARFVLGSAGPSGSLAFSLALLNDVNSDTIAQVLVWTSVLTLLTLALLA